MRARGQPTHGPQLGTSEVPGPGGEGGTIMGWVHRPGGTHGDLETAF